MRVGHYIAAWIAITVTAACGRPAADGNAAAGAADRAVPPAARADAIAPNRVVDPDQWPDPRVRAAYAAAEKYAAIMEHVYCYCRCRENLGHRGLVECFESDHAAMCDICMTEALTVARMTEQGRTPAEIQKAIDVFYAS